LSIDSHYVTTMTAVKEQVVILRIYGNFSSIFGCPQVSM